MSAGIWFWIIYVICALFGGWLGINGDRRWFAGGIIIFILVGLLGWSQFGPPIK